MKRSTMMLAGAALISVVTARGGAAAVVALNHDLYGFSAAAAGGCNSLVGLCGAGAGNAWLEFVKGGLVSAPGWQQDSGRFSDAGGGVCKMTDPVSHLGKNAIATVFTGRAAAKASSADGSGNASPERDPAFYEAALTPTSTSSTSSTLTSSTTTSTLPPRPCGDPANPIGVFASDALWVLKAAVGQPVICEMCSCDVNSSGAITATDALVVLKFAVGQPITFNCQLC